MLTALMHGSRHYWTLHSLPPRRMERRLTVAARWFAEKITREQVAAAHVVFTSDAMNLADLFRSIPALARKPSVVYFHENRLRGHAPLQHDPLELVNLNTILAATQAWFNSQYHYDEFLRRCEAVVRRHRELQNRDVMEQVAPKCLYVTPPVELRHESADSASPTGQPGEAAGRRDVHEVFADLRGVETRNLVPALVQLRDGGEDFHLTAIGRPDALDTSFSFTPLDERDGDKIMAAISRAGVYLSIRTEAFSDELLLHALAAGCWPIVPEAGCYPEVLPAMLHLSCLHDSSVEGIMTRLMESKQADRPESYEQAVWERLSVFDAVAACRIIDDRLEALAARK